MKKEDKELLFKDLCSRLPYHVKCKIWLEDVIEYDTLYEQFIIPQGYQVDTKVIDWEYSKSIS